MDDVLPRPTCRRRPLGIEGVNVYIHAYDCGVAYLAGQSDPRPLPESSDLKLQRLSATRKIVSPDTCATTGYVQIHWLANAQVDTTPRFAGTRIKEGAYASDLILPPPGEYRPSTRIGEHALPLPSGIREVA